MNFALSFFKHSSHLDNFLKPRNWSCVAIIRNDCKSSTLAFEHKVSIRQVIVIKDRYSFAFLYFKTYMLPQTNEMLVFKSLRVELPFEFKNPLFVLIY